MMPPFIAVTVAAVLVAIIAWLDRKEARRRRRQQVLARLWHECHPKG